MDGINNRVLKIFELVKQTNLGIAVAKLVIYEWPVALILSNVKTVNFH